MSYPYEHTERRFQRLMLSLLLLGLLTLGSILYQQSQTTKSPVISLTPTPTTQLLAAFATPSKTGNCQSNNGLPDPACTPGATNPAVTQDTLQQTICRAGYTKTIRPTSSYTNTLKAQQISAYGYTDTTLGDYEEDHLISLELGGSPDSPANLWPEPYGGNYGSREKDKVENYLHTHVCEQQLSLAEAQQQIAENWVAVYTAHFETLKTMSTEDGDDQTQ